LKGIAKMNIAMILGAAAGLSGLVAGHADYRAGVHSARAPRSAIAKFGHSLEAEAVIIADDAKQVEAEVFLVLPKLKVIVGVGSKKYPDARARIQNGRNVHVWTAAFEVLPWVENWEGANLYLVENRLDPGRGRPIVFDMHYVIANVAVGLVDELKALNADVGAKLPLGSVSGEIDLRLRRAGIPLGNLQGPFRVFGALDRELERLAGIVERNEDAERAKRRQDYLPEGIFRNVAARISGLPLCLKVASVVVLWLSAWALVFRGLDGLHGWGRSRLDGLASATGGALLMAAGVLFWF
jgi:hypothetical protein